MGRFYSNGPWLEPISRRIGIPTKIEKKKYYEINQIMELGKKYGEIKMDEVYPNQIIFIKHKKKK